MQHELDDLLPLFLGEARDRLDRITLFLVNLETDDRAASMVRRELHALKGASRMMRLTEMSELCHRAEEMVGGEGSSTNDLLEAVDQLVEMVTELLLKYEQSPDQAEGASKKPETTTRVAHGKAAADLRVTRKLLDELTDRGARVRVLAARASSLVERLLQLGQMAESSISKPAPEQVLAALATNLRQLAFDVEGNQRTLCRHTDHNFDTLLRLQIQPMRPFLLSLARHARELARSLDKEVEVEVEAGESQLDHRIISTLEEAFLHLVRNAVDHGIESKEKRLEAGKPAAGSIRLEASSEGRRVLIKVADDGAGIDAERVIAVAVESGLVSDEEAEQMAPEDALQLIYRLGFSTRTQASTVSGRGVGMDAVAQAVWSIGGDVSINSLPGRGTTVTLEVPVARRGERIIVLRVGSYWLGLPATVARSFRRITPDMVVREPGHHRLRIDDRIIAASFLSDVFICDETTGGVLIEGSTGGSSVAIVADAVLGEEEVLLRPLPASARMPAMFEGMALLASGRSVPVLSPHHLGHRKQVAEVPLAAEERRKIRVLLVDDSLVTREMISRLLEDGGLAVTTAGAADEALSLITEHQFDCIVTDIEMPGMDGLELTRHLRETTNLAHLPIVVVSTRASAEDRLAGLEAGADAYVTKQGMIGHELVTLIHRLGGHS